MWMRAKCRLLRWPILDQFCSCVRFVTSTARMVDYSVRGTIAVLEVNNPPVNALSYAVRKGLYDGIEKATNDGNIKAVVICGKGQTFPAGADIREFGQPRQGPMIEMVGNKIEASEKPVVAAIHGTCLGGGLEVALFCHYRMALETARVGFPEVAIGILPGAAGTQRLPRVTGLSVAMDMITSGRHVPAVEARKYGIIDEIVTGDVLKHGISYAQTVIGKPLNDRRLRFKTVLDAADVQKIAEDALSKVKRKYKGFHAPVSCVKAVRASAELPYEDGILEERNALLTLMGSGQAKAQQYAFFAERAVTRWQMPTGSYKTATAQRVNSTAVIGAGTMGSGIAVCLLSAGLPVFLVEQNEKFLDKGVKSILNIMEGSVRLGKVPAEIGKKAATLLKPTMSYEDLTGVDLVIEAVYENLALKKEIFAKLDKMCKPETILCSNTSTLDIDKIATATRRPDKVVGVHFFSPAYHMKLLENIYGTKTSPNTVATVMKLGKSIGKVCVLVKSCTGFLANRMSGPRHSEAMFLVEEGALPQHVDRVMEDFGMLMGPFKARDLAGDRCGPLGLLFWFHCPLSALRCCVDIEHLTTTTNAYPMWEKGVDIGWRITQEKAKAKGIKLTVDTRYMLGTRYCSLSDRLYNKGRYGRKTGKGWYRYEKVGGKEAMVDDETEQIILEHCHSLGIQRRKISPQEILERSLFSVINEGFKILEDGIALSPEEIDVCWLHGFSFPRYIGGPMFYANQIGLKRVYERVCHYHEQFPESEYWVPSRLLRKLSEADVPMSQWMATAKAKL